MPAHAHFQRKYKKRVPAQPAVLDMAKVLAAANKIRIDVDRVNAAVAARPHMPPHRPPAPAARIALPPEDATRRKPIAQLGSHCPGFSHFNFEFNR